MSRLDEINTSRMGWPTAGPIEQKGDQHRAAIHFGDAVADRPDRRTMWFDSREELLALYNAAAHQLSRWDDIDRHVAFATHPSQPEPLARAPFEPSRPLSAIAVPTSAPLQQTTTVSASAPVPPSAAALAHDEAVPLRSVRPYVSAANDAPAAAAVTPDPIESAVGR